MAALSWKCYDDQCNLSAVLTDAARACVDARASAPAEFLASYFTKITSGGTVARFQCEKAFMPDGGVGLSVWLKLFMNAEGAATGYPLLLTNAPTSIMDTSQPVDGTLTPSTPSHPTAAVCEIVNALHHSIVTEVIPQLQKICVSQQFHWDDVVERATFRIPASKDGSDTHSEPLPRAMCLALSIVASLAAAKKMTLSSYKYYRSLYAVVVPSAALGPLGSSLPMHCGNMDTYVLPQLVITLFGRQLRTANTPSGSGLVSDVYILPGAASRRRPHSPMELQQGGELSLQGASAPEPKGVVPVEVLEKVLRAFRRFSDRHNNPAVREDGAFVINAVDDLTTAVALASDVLKEEGLEPGKDVCLGVRLHCPVTHPGAHAAATSGASGNTGKNKKAAANKPDEIMYALFPGEAEVTGAQVALYVKKQIEATGGVITFVEDTHDIKDTSGLHRLQAYIQDVATVSGRALYDSPNCSSRVEEGLRQSWTSNVSLNPSTVGSITSLMGLSKLVESYPGRRIGLVIGSQERNGSAIVDLAFGLHSRYLTIGGLNSAPACEALSRYLHIQDALLASRCLADQPDSATQIIPDLPPVPEDAVPDIKRKGDKKKNTKH